MIQVYAIGIAGAGVWHAWTSGDWASLGLVPVALLTFGPWLD